NGTLCDFYGNYMKDEMIVLSYTFPGATGWNQITSANTGALGNYYVEWISPATGSFTIKAEWTGNATYFGVVKNVSLSSTPYQNSYVFSVESNSTITALAFDTANWELSFTATGPSGTSGYTKVTVAKSLVVDAANIKVYLDGNQIQYSLVSVDDSWQLVFSYMHSAHQASIALGAKPQVGEPYSLLIVGLIAVIVVVAALALIYFLRYRKATGRVN
nr:hypothetical protein [Candidatus Njordarchaeum guaymaensis]